MKFKARLDGKWEVIDTLYEVKQWFYFISLLVIVGFSIVGWMFIIQMIVF